ncbi:MAG: DUF6691 family protein [Burkholderiaceae bacterium]
MRALSSLISGLIFGLGLLISGMSNPAKVQNFLDLSGVWDPSLAFVMGGAIAVTLPAFWLLKRRSAPMFGEIFHWPTRSDLPPKLFIGAGMFGVGWGLGGYCPGPALAGLPASGAGGAVFVLAMLVGMVLAKMVGSTLDRTAVESAPEQLQGNRMPL